MGFERGTKGKVRVRVPNVEREGIPVKRTLMSKSPETKGLSVVGRLRKDSSVT